MSNALDQNNCRIIKYRVWDDLHKKWIYGPEQEVNLFGKVILFGEFMRHVSVEHLNYCKPLQYTGVKDKNGKEIYEGDIILNKVNDQKCEICWDDSGKWIQANIADGTIEYDLDYYIDHVFVIGNVFEGLVLETNAVVQELEIEEDELECCPNCSERGWDGYMCHLCGTKDIGE